MRQYTTLELSSPSFLRNQLRERDRELELTKIDLAAAKAKVQKLLQYLQESTEAINKALDSHSKV